MKNSLIWISTKKKNKKLFQFFQIQSLIQISYKLIDLV